MRLTPWTTLLTLAALSAGLLAAGAAEAGRAGGYGSTGLGRGVSGGRGALARGGSYAPSRQRLGGIGFGPGYGPGFGGARPASRGGRAVYGSGLGYGGGYGAGSGIPGGRVARAGIAASPVLPAATYGVGGGLRAAGGAETSGPHASAPLIVVIGGGR